MKEIKRLDDIEVMEKSYHHAILDILIKLNEIIDELNKHNPTRFTQNKHKTNI